MLTSSQAEVTEIALITRTSSKCLAMGGELSTQRDKWKNNRQPFGSVFARN
jgi:hypothetical protein